MLVIIPQATRTLTLKEKKMAQTPQGDILFKAASVVDGTEQKPAYKADILVLDGRILSVRPIDDDTGKDAAAAFEATRVVDCEDGKWTLCPGFIDMHAHSDLSLLHTPEHLAKITQGMTNPIQHSLFSDTESARRDDGSHWPRWHLLQSRHRLLDGAN